MRPQSMAMAASPYSRSIMLRPNSPNPPKGMILNGSIVTSNGSFLHGRPNRSRRLFLAGLGRLDLSFGLEVIFYELLNVHRKLPQSSRPMIFHGYRGSDGYFDLAAPNAPIAFRENRPAAADCNRDNRCLGPDGEQKAAPFEWQQIAVAATGPFGENYSGNAAFLSLLGLL